MSLIISIARFLCRHNMRRSSEIFSAKRSRNTSQKRDKYKTSLQITDKHSFHEVIEVLETAGHEYRGNDEDGWRGKLKRLRHKMQEHAQAVEAWLNLLLSSSTWGSILCGGLKLIVLVSNVHSLRKPLFQRTNYLMRRRP